MFRPARSVSVCGCGGGGRWQEGWRYVNFRLFLQSPCERSIARRGETAGPPYELPTEPLTPLARKRGFSGFYQTVCCSPCLCSPLGSRFSATSGETPNNFNISLNSSFIEFPDPSSSDLRLFKRLRPGGNPVRFESRDNGFICEALELLLALDEGTLLSPNNISGRTTERPPGFGLD